MIPVTLNPEIHVTTIELQNEIKSREIENSNNKSSTSVNIREILKQENAEEHKSNVEINKVLNVDTAVSNVMEHRINAAVINVYRMGKDDTYFRKPDHGNPGDNKRGIYAKNYWVQFNVTASMPEGSSPLDYDSSRNSFVAIVFLITFVMLVLTALFVGFVYFTEHLRDYFRYDGKYLFITGMVGMLMLNYAMMCSTCSRVLPCNVVILVLAIILMSLMAAYVTARYRTDIIFFALIATGITVLVCLGLAMTSFDFTAYLLYVIAISVAFCAVVITVAIVALTTGVRYRPLHLVLLVIGTILNVAILIMELQMILGGRAVELSEDDWALAAFMLYTSIVDIFIKLVQLVGAVMSDY